MIDALPLEEALAGAAAAAVAFGVARAQPEPVRRPMEAAVALAVAVAWAFDLAPARLVLPTAVALLVSLVVPDKLRWVGAAIAVGALATTLPNAIGDNHRVVVLIVAVSAAGLAASLGGRQPYAALGVVAATSWSGFVAVPDTDRMGFAVGVVAVVAAGVGLGGSSLATRPGLAVLVAFVVWAGATDSRGRPASFASLVVPLALLVPLAALERSSRRVRLPTLAAISLAVAVYAGRVAGLRSDVGDAAVLGAIGFVLGSVSLVLASGPERQAPASRS